jgi:signal transduction histidine kinase
MQAVSSNTAFALDALGELKEGLAHYEKLRTLAASAIPASTMQEIDTALDEADIDYILTELPRALEKVQSNAERVGKIIRAMQDLSRPSDEDPTPTDLNALIENSTNTLSASWSKVAHLDLENTLPDFHCHPGDFAQVIVHLLTNATQAISAQAGQGQGQLGVRTRRDSDAIELIISDTGTGIPEEVRHRIFDPFFTTREVGDGTGVGLSLVHDIVVNRLGGQIDFTTELGKGTTFTVRLPMNGDN